MIKTKFLIFVLITFYNLTFSQIVRIEGSVFNKNTLQPISYCNITIQNSTRGTTSNSDGVFKVTLSKGENRIKFSSIGFEDTIITVDNANLKLNIFLTEKSYVLDEVVVSPYTCAKQFILEAVKTNEKQRSLIKYYNALSYSKTLFTTKKLGIISLIEAISEVSFFSPNKYKGNTLRRFPKFVYGKHEWESGFQIKSGVTKSELFIY
ncbi:MAG: carboxypeptidase-like regulatory domain-containing protein [Ignavibacteriales bacterium]|nr:carboxypeptidase-like regulatory domain-containing protein [Ignavibacteriales bacterium]